MIDLHSHLLHGVDDGAQTLDEAIALARRAVQDGIRLSVLTPHLHPGRYDHRRSDLARRLDDFRVALAAENVPLEVRLGGEVRFGLEALELLLEDQVPFLGTVDSYRVMLLEFPHQMIPVGSQQFVEKLMQMKIRPLIAHPERNKSVMARPDRLIGFLDSGCWLQLTAGSLVGRFGEAAQAASRYILEQNWAHVIATDAHNMEHRPPVLSEGREAAARIVGEQLAELMVGQRPAEIVGLQ